jgi:hypothetical protein
MTDREFAEQMRIECNRLAGIFGAIATEVSPDSLAWRLAEKGGVKALGLCTLAAQQKFGADHSELATSGYDLAALATAPSSGIEE